MDFNEVRPPIGEEYDGIVTWQGEHIEKYFEKFITDNDIDTVIEIGTFMGGLAIRLHNLAVLHGFQFYTFDINPQTQPLRERLGYIPFRSWKGNVFAAAHRYILKDLITKGGKVLLLCDGGNKLKEFNTFTPFLKEGDFAGMHDFAPDAETFNAVLRPAGWTYHESNLQGIKVKDMERVEPEFFQAVAWGMFKKL